MNPELTPPLTGTENAGGDSKGHSARSSPWRLLFAVSWAVLLIAGLLSSAHAHKRNFAWSYEWFIPYQGEQEIELWLTDSDGEGTWDTRIEYEFAPTHRWGVGLYVTRSEGADGALDFNGWKWENRYRFGDFDLDTWLHAAYLEVKKERGEPYELEAKWLLSRYTDNAVLAVNLTAERALAPRADVEWEASAGWNRSVARRCRAGVEAFGSFSDDQWYLGPSATYDPNPHTRIIATLGLGLTDESDNRVFRLLSEYEW